MDKIIKLFSLRLEKMLQEYTDRVNAMSSWQLDNNIPDDIKHKDINQKRDFIVKKFQMNNTIYNLTKCDLELLKSGKTFSSDLQSLDLDPRYLESIGLKESQIEEYFKFTEKIKALL